MKTSYSRFAGLRAATSKRVEDNSLHLAVGSCAHLQRRPRASFSALLLVTGIGSLFAAEQPPPPVKSFVDANCVDCHDESVAKGGFDITKLPFDLGKPEAFSRWVHVLDRVAAGE